MELIFLLALLFVVVWLNRELLGFGPKGCDWISADAPGDDGTLKWMCQRCGQVQQIAPGTKPQNCEQPPDLK